MKVSQIDMGFGRPVPRSFSSKGDLVRFAVAESIELYFRPVFIGLRLLKSSDGWRVLLLAVGVSMLCLAVAMTMSDPYAADIAPMAIAALLSLCAAVTSLALRVQRATYLREFAKRHRSKERSPQRVTRDSILDNVIADVSDEARYLAFEIARESEHDREKIRDNLECCRETWSYYEERISQRLASYPVRTFLGGHGDLESDSPVRAHEELIRAALDRAVENVMEASEDVSQRAIVMNGIGVWRAVRMASERQSSECSSTSENFRHSDSTLCPF